MTECNNEIQLQHTAILATLQNEIFNIKSSLADLSIMKDTLIEMKVYNKQQLEFNKRQVESNIEFKETLSNINENLNGLNTKMESVDKRVGHLEEKDKETIKETITEKIEDKKSKTEIIKARFTLAASILSAIGVIIVAIIK